MISNCKTSALTLMALAHASGRAKADIAKCLTLSYVTPKQLSFVTGVSIFAIESKLREGKLTTEYLFPTDIKGPKFILRDEKFNDFINNIALKNGG